jgi:hypothetical protein
MKTIAANWKTLVTAVLAGLALFFVSLLIPVGRPSSAKPQTPAMAPAAEPAQEAPISNEIRDFPQLG